MTERTCQTTRRGFLTAVGAGTLAVHGLGTITPIRAATRGQIGQALERREIAFDIHREGDLIGSHVVRFSGTPEALESVIDINIDVSFGPITFYRYKHMNMERWDSGGFRAFRSKTYDDGEDYVVQAETDGQRIKVDRAIAPEGPSERVLPASEFMPTTYWNVDTVRHSKLLDTQTGEIRNVQITPRDAEEVDAGGIRGMARRFDVTGDLDLSLYYDDAGHWMKLSFIYDGAFFDYRLR